MLRVVVGERSAVNGHEETGMLLGRRVSDRGGAGVSDGSSETEC